MLLFYFPLFFVIYSHVECKQTSIGRLFIIDGVVVASLYK